MNPLLRAVLVSLSVIVFAVVYIPVHNWAHRFGLNKIFPIKNIHGVEGIRVIPGTYQCEDAHYHGGSNRIYLACQDPTTKGVYDWAPQLGVFKDPKSIGTGQIVLVDPDTFTATALELKGFTGPLSPHGIDIAMANEKADEDLVTIYVVNHLPNPDHYSPSAATAQSPDKARSQIEIFEHRLGATSATHIRSVRHPLVRTPNDLLAVPPDVLYVTNDHHYREGGMRGLEDVGSNSTAAWSDVVQLTFTHGISTAAKGAPKPAPNEGVTAQIAMDKLHNPNGLGHSAPSRPWEMIINDAAGGQMLRVDKRDAPALKVIEHVDLDGTIDNPSYFTDWYSGTAPDGTGYVLAGLAKGGLLGSHMKDASKAIPVMVWHVRPAFGPVPDLSWGHVGWTKQLIFQDDGRGVKSASAAVMVGIDPADNGGKKEGWLFVTGFASDAMVAAKINFDIFS